MLLILLSQGPPLDHCGVALGFLVQAAVALLQLFDAAALVVDPGQAFLHQEFEPADVLVFTVELAAQPDDGRAQLINGLFQLADVGAGPPMIVPAHAAAMLSHTPRREKIRRTAEISALCRDADSVFATLRMRSFVPHRE